MEIINFNPDLLQDENIISWNNRLACYFDRRTLPYNISGLNDLNGKWAVYYLITKSRNMLYIGVTQDFGQRITTHINRSRDIKHGGKRKLYKDIEQDGCVIAGIFGVYETYEEGRAVENTLIKEYKDYYLTEEYGKDYDYLLDREEQKKFLFDKIYNINN